nr:unnamed protein product [Digitaria exilis]
MGEDDQVTTPVCLPCARELAKQRRRRLGRPLGEASPVMVGARRVLAQVRLGSVEIAVVVARSIGHQMGQIGAGT